MTPWIKRAFPLLGIAGLIACAILAARTVNHLIDARYLGESPDPVWTDHDQRPPAAAPTGANPAMRDKSGAALAARNMFCFTCTPEVDAPPTPGALPEDGLPLSDLPLELLATNLARPVRASFATVRHRDSGRQGSFFTGDRLPGAGAIERIEGSDVVFHNPERNRLERISLMAARPDPERRNRPARSQPSAPGNKYAASVNKIDDTTYEVERTLIDKFMTNPNQLGARVRPVTGKDGGVAFKLYGVRKNSPLSAIGIRNGDAIEAINGHALTTSPDKMLELYTKMKDQQRLSVSVRRRGELLAMDYRVR